MRCSPTTENGQGSDDDDLDNRPKHSEGIPCRPKKVCEELVAEEKQSQFRQKPIYKTTSSKNFSIMVQVEIVESNSSL